MDLVDTSFHLVAIVCCCVKLCDNGQLSTREETEQALLHQDLMRLVWSAERTARDEKMFIMVVKIFNNFCDNFHHAREEKKKNKKRERSS